MATGNHRSSADPRGGGRALLLAALLPLSDGWPEFRGPGADGRVADGRPPLEWSEERNVTWKIPLQGRAWSTPVVQEGRIWMTSAPEDGRRLSVICVDLDTGDVLHDFVLFENDKPQFVNALNSHASPSPVGRDGRIFVHFGAYGTACLDAATAQVLWQRRDLECEHLMGPGSSPVLYEGLLIFHVDGADVQYVIALDQATGDTVWKTPRSVDLAALVPDLRKAYSTPLLVDGEGGTLLISTGAQGAYAYEPGTGKEVWRVRYEGFSMSSRPVALGGRVFLNTGFNRARLLAVRLGGSGDVTDTHVEWTYQRNVPTMPSPVVTEDGLLFFVSDEGGLLTCLDTATGEAVWRERIGGSHCASLLLVGERIHAFDREGRAVVLKAGREFQVLAENLLEDGMMASPIVLGRTLLLRTKGHLYRIEES